MPSLSVSSSTMTTRPAQPEPRTPDESVMLAFVEGEMTPVEEAALRRSLSHAPPVQARLEAMRRDKALLRASMLRESLVPGSLAARVDEAISREALLTAAAGEPSLGFVEPALRTRVHARWRIGRNGPALVPALSMAAALALVVGGTVLVLNAVSAPQGAGGPGPLTRGGTGDGSAVETADRAVGESSIASGTTGARGADRTVETTDADPTSIAAASVGEGSDGSPTRIALAPGASDPLNLPTDLPAIDTPEPTTPTRLLPGGVARRDLMALAEQNRLALRVTSDEPAQVIAALEAAALGETDSGWRIVADAPITLAGSLSVGISPFGEDALAAPAGGSGGNDAGVPEVIDPDETDGDPAAEPGADRPDDEWLLRPTDDAWAVYLAEVDLTEEGLAALDRDLREAGHGRAGFAALADPLESAIGPRMMLIPAGDVVWWYHPPREWSRRTLVPIVVERD